MTARKTQKLMPFPASQEFIDKLHAGLEATRYSNRSQFIRDAIVEKLELMGIRVPAGLAAPPPRGLAALMLKARKDFKKPNHSQSPTPATNGSAKRVLDAKNRKPRRSPKR